MTAEEDSALGLSIEERRRRMAHLLAVRALRYMRARQKVQGEPSADGK